MSTLLSVLLNHQLARSAILVLYDVDTLLRTVQKLPVRCIVRDWFTMRIIDNQTIDERLADDEVLKGGYATLLLLALHSIRLENHVPVDGDGTCVGLARTILITWATAVERVVDGGTLCVARKANRFALHDAGAADA